MIGNSLSNIDKRNCKPFKHRGLKLKQIQEYIPNQVLKAKKSKLIIT
jgi:hypothetical protein